MNKLLNFPINNPWLVILTLMLLTGLLTTLLPRLQFDVSAQGMMVRDDPMWKTYQQSLKTYGSDSVVILFLHDDSLFDPRKLEILDEQLKKIIKLDFVRNSSSLFSVPNVVERDGYIITDAFLKTLPQNEAEARKIVDDALRNPLVAGNLVSRDGRSMAINLRLADSIHYPGRDQDISQTLEQMLEPLREEFSLVFQMSAPYVRGVISEHIQQDQNSILPAALVVLLIVLGVSMKSINSALIPFFTALMSIVFTLAMMASLEIPINVLTSIIPALLIIVGSTEDVHLIAEYRNGIRRGLSRPEAVAMLPVTQSVAISLAFATTFIGFLSITLSKLDLLREFGLLVSAGLLFNFVITVLFVPAWLRLFGEQQLEQEVSSNLYQRFARAVFTRVIRYKQIVLGLLVATLVIFLWGARHLEVNNNTLAYFAPESEINQRAGRIHEELSGMQSFSILLESPIQDTFLKHRYLQDIERIQQFIDERGVFDKTFSFADFIKLIHRVMEGASVLSLPQDDELIAAYMGLVQVTAVRDYVNPDFSQARILVRHNLASSQRLNQELNAIREFIKNDLQTRLDIEFSGETVLTSHAADMMAVGQIQSLLLMVVIIFLLVSLLFLDLRAGLLALAPNVFPVVVLFGVMGYFRIPLDTGTTMVSIIALGICVDDTIHFLSRYHNFTRGTQDVEQALLKTVTHEATPITTTSVALALGFLTLTLSSFQPVVNFGALSALVMGLALLSTFILTPILLSYTRLITVWDMLSLNIKSAVLKNSPIFRGMTSFQIRKAILSGAIQQFRDGQIMVEQGSRGSGMYVILEGGAVVTKKDPDGSIHTLGTLDTGELFGEISLLCNLERTARVSALDHARVLIIEWQSIRDMELFHPRISMTLYRNLSITLGQRVVSRHGDQSEFRDELTGALTRTFFLEQLEIEHRRCLRHQEKLSALMMEIELPAQPHQGNTQKREQAIRALSQIIVEQTRGVDVFARWEENRFIMALPRTPAQQARNLSQRIIEVIHSTELPDIGYVRVRACVTETDGERPAHELLDELKEELEKMKQTSRDAAPQLQSAD